MNRISKKEYSTNVFKYLKPGKMILTSHGKDSLLITIATLLEDNSTAIKTNDTPIEHNSTSIDTSNSTPIKKVANVQQRIDKVLTTVPGISTVEEKRPDNIASGNRYAKKFTPNWQRDTSKYGCGCKKEEGKALCTKHGRG